MVPNRYGRVLQHCGSGRENHTYYMVPVEREERVGYCGADFRGRCYDGWGGEEY